MRKAKIIATMGPACEDERVLAEMVAAGMNVARFNMSHGDQASHKKQIDSVKRIRERFGIALPIMIDTKGPEIRIKQFENGEVVLKEKQRFTLTTRDEVGSSERVSVTYKNLPNIVGRGTRILLADGVIELRVISTTETDVNCEVVFGGVLGNNKSINIPGVELDLPYLSAQDKADILFAVNERAEYLAISFVRNKEDVGQIRAYLHRLGDKEMKIISKIENQEGVDNIDEIIDLCWFFEEKLPLPTIKMTNTVSYFTKSGNRTFHKAINKAKKAFLEKGSIVSFLDKSSNV